MDILNSQNRCTKCHTQLLADDIGIYMKMVSRNATSFLCMSCLAQRLGCPKEFLEDRVRYFRESGNCTLFCK